MQKHWIDIATISSRHSGATRNFSPRHSLIIPRKPKGSVASLLLFATCSIVVVVALAIAALQLRTGSLRESKSNSNSSIRIYCASGVASPVQTVLDHYNRDRQTNIAITRTGGSGELTGQVKMEFESRLRNGADLLITADVSLIENAIREGFIDQQFTLATQRPVIAVRVDSPLQIDSFRGLSEPKQIKFGLASKNAAIGKLSRLIAQRDGFLEEIESQLATEAENVMTLGQAVVAGSLDAAVLWDTTVNQINQSNPRPVLKVAAFADPTDQLTSEIAIAVLSASRNPKESIEFSRYLSNSSRSKEILSQFGYRVQRDSKLEALNSNRSSERQISN